MDSTPYEDILDHEKILKLIYLSHELTFFISNSVGSNHVLKFNVRLSEAKIRISEFDYQKINTFMTVQCSKNNVPVGSMSNLVYLVIALSSLMFDVLLFKAKIGEF